MGEKGESSGTVEVVMDTPDRSKTQITAPMSKFEDSPVFNFLNSLSPIKPVKSLHITQTFNPLSFASIPSVFTSPHVTSLKESRFLRRHQLGDPSKPEFASDNVNKDDTNEGIAELAPASTEHQESINPGSSTGEAYVEPSYECQQFADEIVQSLNYDCSSPSSSRTPNRGLKTKLMSEVAGSSAALVPYIQEESAKMFIGAEANAEGVSQTDQNKESAECDWGLISDAADLLIFDSPNDAEGFKKSMDPATRFYTSITNNVQSIQALVAVGPGEQLREESELEHQFTQPGDGNELEEFPETQDVNDSSSLGVNCMAGGPVDSGDPENVCNLYRGMRRRCLVFELSGARRKHLHENSTSDCAMLPQPDGDTISSDKQLVLTKTGNESSRCVLPGIGLHLNALATTSKDYKVVKNEALASGRQLVIASGSAANFHMLNTGQESLSRPIDMTQSEREITPLETGVPVLEEGSQASGYVVNEEFNQNSPKKKRRRLENGEGEACKRCNCKKSKCLKLYCECFAAGVYCVEPCSCLDCFNKPIHEDTVLATRKQIESRNPLAFAPKVIRSNDPLSETGDDSSKTPASARHKRGCNCKKSGCLKKYCECYQGGVGCSINCRCEGCKNAFGRKDGSALIGSEPELEEEETDMGQKSVRDGSHPRSVIQCDAEQNPDYVPPATPLPFGGPPMQLPFVSKNKPPRSSHLSVGSSSGLYTSQGFGKSNFFLPQPKFDKSFGTVQEDEMPEILQTNGSPISGVKSTSSPNSKRVSPPHVGPGMLSPGQRSSRKLILQSIPSFPSLTPKH